MENVNETLKNIYKRDHDIDDVITELKPVSKSDLIDFIQWHFDRGNLKLNDWDIPTDSTPINKEGYNIIDREDEIENLIRYITETTSNNEKELMKEDLKYLMSLDCKKVYSSEDTNDYIAINK